MYTIPLLAKSLQAGIGVKMLCLLFLTASGAIGTQMQCLLKRCINILDKKGKTRPLARRPRNSELIKPYGVIKKHFNYYISERKGVQYALTEREI